MKQNNIDILDALDMSSDKQEEQKSNFNINEEQIEAQAVILENESIESKEQEVSLEAIVETEKEIVNFSKDEATNPAQHSIKDSFIFFIKYISTSFLIFFALLLTTNYSAYATIAKSYFFQEEMQQMQNSIMSSVEASQITKTIKTKKEARKKATEQNNNTTLSKYSIKNLATQVTKSDYKLDIEITPFENRIIIPKIAKNIPLLDIKDRSIAGPKELENIFMKELENGVVRYPGSTKPGKDGNTFIFGHSSNFPWIKGDYNDVFATLDNVNYGDEVIVYYNQKKYKYKIKEKKVITPGDVKILKRQNNIDEITIMTCWPIGTTLNRLIVVGEIVKEEEK